MLTALHFLELRSSFHDQEIGMPFSVTIEKLTGVWHCTARYAKLIVRKLSESGWIYWQAGRGRGNTSVLTLLTDSDDILLQEVKQKMEQGHVKEAMELMNRFGAMPVKDRFMDWLSEGMGFSTQTIADKLQDTLRFPVYRSIVTLDPGLVYYTFDAHIIGQIFDTLVEFEHESRTIKPCIAHSWETSHDAREWIFHLRKNIMFHHGRELTAHDVVFTLDRLRKNADRFETSWMFQDIELVEAIDFKTVRIRLQSPNYLFLRFLCTTPASIVPADLVLSDEAVFGSKPVGTGPFRLTRLTEGICVLEAFPAHFQGRPHLDRVEVLIFPESEAGRLKEPDWTSVMTAHGDTSQKGQEVEEHPDWFDLEMMYSCCSLLVFNQAKEGPQKHLKFREALHHLIDRDQMIVDLGGDRILPAQGFRPSAPDYSAANQLSRSEIEGLLKESGYNGEPFCLATTGYHEEDARWLQTRCQSFGINMVIEIKEPSKLAAHDSPQQHDCQLFGNVYSGDEVSELEMYLQKNYFLSSFDQETAEAVKKAAALLFREADEMKRQLMLADLEELMQRTRSVLYLVQKKSSTSYHKSLRGVTINPSGWVDFHRIWFHPLGRG
ncbi:SgrR family transcriptional regulator [Brevibacillus migulae]|uniref:SgrR family transcriptional regulator n=1 Tax=Brevibacillus migulae TaxID=1644114 RepID=UPI00106E234C|nr:SgrR family transcriptional regulator [Brevibacillus migulae]